MKISGSRRIGTSGAVGKARGKKVSGNKFSVSMAGEAPAAANISSAGPLAAVDSLLALQEVGRRDGARAQVIQRGHDILDQLDEIRHALLLGVISKSRLEGIARLVRTRRDQIDDPRLVEVLDEIELRAEVELAKLSL